MQQTVYVDVLLFLNIIINFYILLITARISRNRIVKYRILVGGFIGGLMSLSVLLPELPTLLSLLIKILGSSLISFISYKWQGLKKYIITTSWFLVINFIFAGSVLFFCFVLKTPLVYFNNSNFYFDISAPFLVVIATLTFILFSFVIKSSQKPVHIQKYYELSIYKCGQSISCVALADTGNSLKDYFSGTPVLLADFSAVEKILPDTYHNFFTDDSNEALDCSENLSDVRLIPYTSVSGAGYFKAFICDEIIIYGEQSNYKIKNSYVAVCEGKLSNGNYQAVLNPEIFDIAEKIA